MIYTQSPRRASGDSDAVQPSTEWPFVDPVKGLTTALQTKMWWPRVIYWRPLLVVSLLSALIILATISDDFSIRARSSPSKLKEGASRSPHDVVDYVDRRSAGAESLDHASSVLDVSKWETFQLAVKTDPIFASDLVAAGGVPLRAHQRASGLVDPAGPVTLMFSNNVDDITQAYAADVVEPPFHEGHHQSLEPAAGGVAPPGPHAGHVMYGTPRPNHFGHPHMPPTSVRANSHYSPVFYAVAARRF